MDKLSNIAILNDPWLQRLDSRMKAKDRGFLDDATGGVFERFEDAFTTRNAMRISIRFVKAGLGDESVQTLLGYATETEGGFKLFCRFMIKQDKAVGSLMFFTGSGPTGDRKDDPTQT